MIRYDIVRNINSDQPLAAIIYRGNSLEVKGLSAQGEDWASWVSANISEFSAKDLDKNLQIVRTSYSSSEIELQKAISRIQQKGISMSNKATHQQTVKTGAISMTPSFREFQIGVFDPETRNMVIDFKALAFVSDSVKSSKALDKRLGSPVVAVNGEISTKAARPRLGGRIGGGLRSPGPGMAFVDVTGQIDADADGIVFERTPMQRPIIPRLNIDGSPLQVPRTAAQRSQQSQRQAARRAISAQRGQRSFSEDRDIEADLDEMADRQFREGRFQRPSRPQRTVAELRRDAEQRRARRAASSDTEAQLDEIADRQFREDRLDGGSRSITKVSPERRSADREAEKAFRDAIFDRGEGEDAPKKLSSEILSLRSEQRDLSERWNAIYDKFQANDGDLTDAEEAEWSDIETRMSDIEEKLSGYTDYVSYATGEDAERIIDQTSGAMLRREIESLKSEIEVDVEMTPDRKDEALKFLDSVEADIASDESIDSFYATTARSIDVAERSGILDALEVDPWSKYDSTDPVEIAENRVAEQMGDVGNTIEDIRRGRGSRSYTGRRDQRNIDQAYWDEVAGGKESIDETPAERIQRLADEAGMQADAYEAARDAVARDFAGSPEYNDALAAWSADNMPGREPSPFSDEEIARFEESDEYNEALGEVMSTLEAGDLEAYTRQGRGQRSYQDIAQEMFRNSDDFNDAIDDYMDSPEYLDDDLDGDIPTTREFMGSQTYQEYLARFMEDNADDIDSVYNMSRDGKPLSGEELDRALEIRRASGVRSISKEPLSSDQLDSLSDKELADRIISDRFLGLTLEEAARKYGLPSRDEARRIEAREMQRRRSAGEAVLTGAAAELALTSELSRSGLTDDDMNSLFYNGLTSIADPDQRETARQTIQKFNNNYNTDFFGVGSGRREDGQRSRSGSRSSSYVPTRMDTELNSNNDYEYMGVDYAQNYRESDAYEEDFMEWASQEGIENPDIDDESQWRAFEDSDFGVSAGETWADEEAQSAYERRVEGFWGGDISSPRWDRNTESMQYGQRSRAPKPDFMGEDDVAIDMMLEETGLISDELESFRRMAENANDPELEGAIKEILEALEVANDANDMVMFSRQSAETVADAISLEVDNGEGPSVMLGRVGALIRDVIDAGDNGEIVISEALDESGTRLTVPSVAPSSRRRNFPFRRRGSRSRTETGSLMNVDVTGSSAIRQASYDPDNQELIVTFPSGRTYTYGNVSIDELPYDGPLSGRLVNEFKKTKPVSEGGTHLFDPEFQNITGPGERIGRQRLSRVGRGEKTQIPVGESSAVEKLTWDDAKKELIVTYKGGRTYTYEDVDDYWIDNLEREPNGAGRILNGIKKEGYRVSESGEHGDMPSDALSAERARFGMRSRSSGAIGSARSRAAVATEERSQARRGMRREAPKPGVSRMSDSDGRIWESMTPEERDVVRERAQKLEKELFKKFKSRFRETWQDALEQSQSPRWRKREGWIDEDTPFPAILFAMDAEVRQAQRRTDLSPKMRADIQRDMDDLRTLYAMRDNGNYEFLEHLHGPSRGFLFDDAKRDDGKSTSVSASSVRRSPSTAFGVVRQADAPSGAEAAPDSGTSTPRPSKPRREKTAAWAERMRDAVLYESARRRRLREMRKARKGGQNAGAFSPDERSPLKPLERKARLAKRNLILKKGAKRDVPELTDDATKNRVVGRLAVRDKDGNITISESLATALGAAFDADAKHKRLSKSKKKAPEGGWRNEDLAFLWDGAGYNGTPMPITQDQYDALIDAGWTPLVRGHGAERYAEDYIDDPVRFIPGQGGEAAGPGEYFALMPQGQNWYGFVRRDEASATVALLPPDARRVSQSELKAIQKEHRKIAQAIRAFDSGLPEGEREKMDGAEYSQQVADYLRSQLGEGALSSDMGQIVAQLLNQLSTASPAKKRDILDAIKYLNLIAHKDSPNYYAPILGFDAISVDERELIMNRTAVVVLGETKDYDGVVAASDRVREMRKK